MSVGGLNESLDKCKEEEMKGGFVSRVQGVLKRTEQSISCENERIDSRRHKNEERIGTIKTIKTKDEGGKKRRVKKKT